MGRKNQGKTATIKQRRVPVYLPDLETKERWKKEAEDLGYSKMSEFIRNSVELYLEYIHSNREEDLEELDKLRKDNGSLKKTLDWLMDENKKLKKLIEMLEYDLNLCRKRHSLSEKDGIGMIDKKLISILKEGPKTEDEIMNLMGIKRDEQKAEFRGDIVRQLQLLLELRFVSYDGKVWKWVG